jgi:hypothetical protein
MQPVGFDCFSGKVKIGPHEPHPHTAPDKRADEWRQRFRSDRREDWLNSLAALPDFRRSAGEDSEIKTLPIGKPTEKTS